MQHHDVIRFRQKPCPPRGIALALGRLAGFATWRAGRVVRGRRPVGISEVTFYRWRKEYGGMSGDQLRRAVSDLTLDKQILAEAARGNL